MFKKVILPRVLKVLGFLINPFVLLVAAFVAMVALNDKYQTSWALLMVASAFVSLVAVVFGIAFADRTNKLVRLLRLLGYLGVAMITAEIIASFWVVDINRVGRFNTGSFTALRILNQDGSVQRAYLRKNGWARKPCAACVDRPVISGTVITAHLDTVDQDGAPVRIKVQAEVSVSEDVMGLYDIFSKERYPQAGFLRIALDDLRLYAGSLVMRWPKEALEISLRCPPVSGAHKFERIVAIRQ